MADTFTTRNRIRKIETGTRPNTWGTVTSTDVLDLADFALDGWTTKALSGNVVLTSVSGGADESRARVLKFTGTGAYEVTIPSVEKMYVVDNQLTGNLTIKTGSGTTAVIGTTESAVVVCDGTNVKAIGVSKSYVDGLVLPTQTGNSGKFLTTNGTAASWSTVPTAGIADAAVTSAKLASGAAVSNIGYTPGYRGYPTDNKSADYSFVLADVGRMIRHNSGSAHNFAIQAQATIAWSLGDWIEILNIGGTLTVNLAVGVTLNWNGSTGNRTIAANGKARITCIDATGNYWLIEGVGIS